MPTLNTLPFSQLHNAEHVAFFNNVMLAINKVGAEDLGLDAEKFAQFAESVSHEQDIVLKAQGSEYTDDMQDLDDVRDRLYTKLRYKLQALCLESDDSQLAAFRSPLEKYILNKYSPEIKSLPYHEESAHLSGLDLDMHDRFTDDDLTLMGIHDDLVALKLANDRFSEMYHSRAIERAGSTPELTKKLRSDSETLFSLLGLQINYNATLTPDTDKGLACTELIGVINQFIKDVRQRVNIRLGKKADDDTGLDPNVSPIPFPEK